MRRFRQTFIPLTLGAMLVAGHAVVETTGDASVIADVAGDYHALVIGNNEYAHMTRLKTAVSDAAAVAELLKLKYDYDVKLILNATRADILEEINRYRGNLTPDDRLLIYYAGHGTLDRETGTGYWQPVDAEPESDTHWIPVRAITRHLKAMTARHVLVVADSCYSGTLVRTETGKLRTGDDRSEYLRRMAAKRARTALVSGGLEPVVDAGSGGHSVFAAAFLTALRENDTILDGQELFREVRQSVVMNADQTPQYSDIRMAAHEGGDFLFIPIEIKGTVAIPRDAISPAPPAFDERAMELEYWQSVKASGRARDFEGYLAQYPDGAFASLARSHLDGLKEDKQVAVVVPPKIVVAPMDTELVAVKTVNLRAGPSTDYEKVGKLSAGEHVTVTGKVKDAEWYRVEGDEGKPAYVYAKLLGEPLAEPPAPAEPAKLDPLAAEIAFWDSVKNSTSAADYKAYLETYPKGRFASLARARAKQYAAVTVPQRPAPETPAQPAVGIYPGTKEPGSTFKDCPECPEMGVIPAGNFTMGSPASEKGRYDDEGPQHEVRIPRAFALGKYEVTRGGFEAFVRATGHKTSDGCRIYQAGEWQEDSSRNWRDPGYSQSDSHPVACVNWQDAKAYVRWLSGKTGKEYRLPSEAEWEYAARARTTAARYWGSNSSGACGYANVHDQTSKSENGFSWVHHDCRDGYGQTAPVGRFQANGFGLHDVLGNVWAWVGDCWNDSYRGAPSNVSAWTKGNCSRRVLRGGSWDGTPRVVRSANRAGDDTSNRSDDIGFRVARTVTP